MAEEMDAKTVMVADAKRPAEPTTSPDNDKSKQPKLSAAPLGSSGDDSLFGLADYISSMVVQFLGVRSLVSFGATGKSHRETMQNEVKRRKECIAEVEVEVTRLILLNYPTTSMSTSKFTVIVKFMIRDMRSCGSTYTNSMDSTTV